MTTAAIARAMLEAGCTAEQIVQAIERLCADGDEAARIRREKAAERQRKSRLSRSVTVTSRDACDVTEPAPRARVVISNPPTEDSYIKNPPSGVKKGRDLAVAPAKGSRIADGWQPDPEGLEFAVATLGSLQAARLEADKFRDYWRAIPGARGVKLDWGATWKNWVRKSVEMAAQRAPPIQQSRGSRSPSAAELLRNLDAGKSINSVGDPFASGPDGAGGGLRGGGDVSGGRVVDLRPARAGWT